MSTIQKHERDVLDSLRSLGAKAELVNPRSPGHKKVVVTVGVETVTVRIAGSPRDEDNCVHRVVRDVRRALAERGVEL